jgi:hypothetical protein
VRNPLIYIPPTGSGSRGQFESRPPCCPSCRSNDRIEKISGIVRRGSLVGPTTDLNEAEPIVSGLAQELYFPDAPRAMSYRAAAVTAAIAWAAGIFLLLLIRGLRAQDIGIPEAALDGATWMTVAWFGFAAPMLAFLRSYSEQRRTEDELPAWKTAYYRWSSAYYCFRDDVIFLPDEGVPYLPEQMAELLRGAVIPSLAQKEPQ